MDPALSRYAQAERDVLEAAVADLIQLDPQAAISDLEVAERELDREALGTLLRDLLNVGNLADVAAALAHERYSTLVRCLVLFHTLHDVLGPMVDLALHQPIRAAIAPEEILKAVARRTAPVAGLGRSARDLSAGL